MSLIFYWGYTTLLNPVDVVGEIGSDGVKDLVKVLDSTYFALICLRFDVAKNRRVLFICPVRKLVMAKIEVDTIGIIVLANDLVPVYEYF